MTNANPFSVVAFRNISVLLRARTLALFGDRRFKYLAKTDVASVLTLL